MRLPGSREKLADTCLRWPPPSLGTKSIWKRQTTKMTKQDRNCYHPRKEAALNHQNSDCSLGLPHPRLLQDLGAFPTGKCQAPSNSRRGKVGLASPPQPPSPEAASSGSALFRSFLWPSQHCWLWDRDPAAHSSPSPLPPRHRTPAGSPVARRLQWEDCSNGVLFRHKRRPLCLSD